MKTILVLTDFSAHALFALKVAASIAKKISGKINLVHVYQHPALGEEFSYYYTKEYYEEISTDANKQLDQLLDQSFLEGVHVERQVVSGSTIADVLNNVKFKHPDLIVMGSHGRTGYDMSFIGSNTEKVVRLSEAPVLTLKNEIEDFTIDRMVFASNFLDESYHAFSKIKFFADLYDAHIDLLKVITPKDFETTEQSLKLLSDFAREFKLTDYSINVYNDYDIESGILNFSNKTDADLIAIETHGRTGFAHLINGSLAEDIVKHEVKPILSIKMKKTSGNAAKKASSELSSHSWGAE